MSILSSFDDLIRINKNKVELLNNFVIKFLRNGLLILNLVATKKLHFAKQKLGKIPKDWKLKKYLT